MRKFCLGIGLALLGSVGLYGQVPGRNVNMVSGTTLPDGDPFLQRQNEPSLAASTRNPQHLLGGANDYRTVDLPGLPDDLENGDAWLGLYKSIDGGLTWKTSLLPGYPQDKTPIGLASPLHGYQAAADPTVRAGANGLMYYSGIAFNRGSPAPGSVFVARFIDRNNKENGDPFAYLGVTLVQTENSSKFLDKPWIAVDMPRDGTCFVDGQRIPGGNVYLVYSVFTGVTGLTAVDPDEEEDQDQLRPGVPDDSKKKVDAHGQIMFTRSRDCGTTWSRPELISTRTDTNQGATIAIDPATGTVYVSWRQFADPNVVGSTDAIYIVRSTDGGKKFSSPVRVSTVAPFDQGTSSTSFRTNAYPTMTVDQTGRIYVAWAARGFAPQRPDPLDGDSRIVISTSTDFTHWSAARAIDNSSTIPGHQIMPSLTYAAGKLQIAYYDLRETVAQLFAKYITDAGLPKRHTIDVRAAQALPGPNPIFTSYTVTPPQPSAEVSDYMSGSRPGSTLFEQLQFNPPNLPLFRQGGVPFVGDYLDVAAAPAFVLTPAGTWAFNTASTDAAIFHVAWTDNRDVRPPADGNWAHYTPPTYTGPGLEPGLTPPACTPGQTGMRNQNIYTARITPGLVAGSPGNTKPLTPNLQRGFVVYAQNTTTLPKSFRLTIDNQPPGGRASFAQFPLPPYDGSSPPPVTTMYVNVPARSMAARTVYVTSTDPRAKIDVSVVQVAGPNQPPVPGGDTAKIALNPDITNPAITNPDITNPDITNPDITNAEVANPDITNPAITNPVITNPDITNPDITNPDITNVSVANPDITNPSITNPDITNPDITNPDITNPSITNPDITNGSITDVTWTIVNNGNTAAAYSSQLLIASGAVPPGFKLQLTVYKTYKTPVAVDCDLKTVTQNQLIANVNTPLVKSTTGLNRVALTDANEDPDDVTFFLAPGEEARMTLRVVDPDRHDPIVFDAPKVVFPAVQAEAVNSDDAQHGITEPPIILPPSAAAMAFLVQPLDTLLNQAIAPAVQVKVTDVIGGPVKDVDVGLALTPSPGALHGNAPVKTNANGVATFHNLRVDTGGTYTLTASAPAAGIPDAVSAAFAISGVQGVICPTPTFVTTPIGTVAPPGVLALADFDANGLRDVAVGVANDVVVFSQVAGIFTQTAIIPIGDSAGAIAAADMNGDGRPDVIVATSNTFILRVLTNTPGGFVAGPTVTLTGFPNALAVGDANGDGFLDVIATAGTNNELLEALGNGDGTVANPVVIPGLSSWARDIAVGDFNADDKLDVVAALNNSLIAVLTGDGNGGFTATSFVALSSNKLALGDFNEDGILDLAALSGALTVNIFLGDGTGQFVLSDSRTAAAGATTLVVGDYNGDGHLDVAVANFTGLFILAGDAAGHVAAPPPPYALPSAPFALASADLNGDGRADLITKILSGEVIGVVNACGSLPTIVPNVSGTAGGGGWYRSDVNVTWTVFDPNGIQSTSGCDPTLITTETTGQLLTCTATNNLGFSDQKSVTIKIDKTPPSVLSTTVSPPPNLAGWNKTVPVVVASTGADVGPIQSGSVTCTQVSLNSETPGTSAMPQCSDLAGNTTDALAVTVRIDLTNPAVIFGTSNPPPPLSGPYNRDVIIPFTIADALSGVASSMPQPVYVTDINRHTVSRVDPTSGAIVDLYGGGSAFSGIGAAVSPANGKIYFAEDDQRRIFRMDQSGQNLEVVYDFPTATPPNNPNDVLGLAFAPNGDLFFTHADVGSKYGVWKIAGGTPGTPPVQAFAIPNAAGGQGIGLAFAPNGDLFVADQGNNQILKSSPPYSTFSVFVASGSLPTCTVFNDEDGANLPFCIFGVAVNGGGDVFVSYLETRSILRFDPTGASLPPLATFDAPQGPVFTQFDAAGSLWVNTLDFEGQTAGTLWRVAPGGAVTAVATAPNFGPIGVAMPPTAGATVYGTVAFTATSAGVPVTATDLAGNANGNTSPSVVIDKNGVSSDFFTVTNTQDSGDGSLRQAIVNSNAHAGVDTITFNIQPPGQYTIQPLTELPSVEDPAIIDASTQPGWALGAPAIQLRGTNVTRRGSGLAVAAGGTTIRGFVINRWPSQNVWLHGLGNNTIVGNFIGTNLAGNGAGGPNPGAGIMISSVNNLIGGTTAADRNVISNNQMGGIQLNGETADDGSLLTSAAGTLIQGNYIGTTAAGTGALGNNGPFSTGIAVNAPNITIGGTTAGAGNLISGHNFAGIGTGFNTNQNHVIYSQGTNVAILGNRIGTNAAGTDRISNANGVWISSPNAQIGGPSAAAQNVISGNGGNGIQLTSLTDSFNNTTSGTNAVIENNIIGLDATGMVRLTTGSGGTGINVSATGAIIGPNNVIAGIGISPAFRNAVQVNNSGSATIAGNFIGTNAGGASGLGNTGNGVVLNSSNNVVGGSSVAARNVISGNGGTGVTVNALDGQTLIGNIIKGNYIGLTPSGSAALGNVSSGVSLTHQIGGDLSGVVNNTTIDGNVISGNTDAGPGLPSGISLSAGTNTTSITGNFIGTDSSGTSAIPNESNGVFIQGSSNNTIGGTTPAARNVISGNGNQGISFSGTATPPSNGNVVAGNYIGTNAAGTAALPNAQNGISFTTTVGAVTNTTIGGTASGAGNLISGNNANGISISAGATGTIIQGNLIGTNVNSNTPLANRNTGISVNTGAGATIGGTAAGAGNVISGNGTATTNGSGIGFNNGSTGSLVQGNHIGTDRTGTVAVPNRDNGIFITTSTNNTIGGTSSAARNVISGNGAFGFFANGVSIGGVSTGNTVAGNYIGTNETGTAPLANVGAGVSLAGSGNTIGGTAPGAGNVISGNGTPTTNAQGITISVGGNSNTVQGNLIGTDATGAAAVPNRNAGISISGNTNTIGGTTAAERNVVSGNGAFGTAASGIAVSSGATGNIVSGNYVGLTAAGTGALPNTGVGLFVGGTTNTIGGTAAGAGNTISGNASGGMSIGGPSNVVQGNFIGTNPTGTAAIANTLDGVFISGNNNTIGGTVAGAGNVISGNTTQGISTNFAGVSGTIIQGNRVGTNTAGTAAIPNTGSGISLDNASNTTVGGTTAAARNIISGNGTTGINIPAQPGFAMTGNVIQGNYIGADAAGTGTIPNGLHGINMFAGAGGSVTNTTIGGTAPGAGNVILGNAHIGVFAGSGVTGAAIRGNSITGNGEIGIDLLGNVGPTLNDPNDPDTGANNLQNFPVLTLAVAGASTYVEGNLNSGAGTTYALDFYASALCDPSGFGEGARYLGSTNVTTVGNNVSFQAFLSGASSPTEAITATATDPSGNTSELSQCFTAGTSLADVSIAMSRSPATPVLAQPVTYTLTVSNAGPNTAAAANVTDTLPAGLTFASVYATQGSCSQASGTVTCALGAIANGGTARVTLTATANSAQPVLNAASVAVSGNDPNSGNNSASDSAVVSSFGPCNAGTLSGPASATTGPAPGFMATGDFNHDGYPDVVVSATTGTAVIVLLGGPGGLAAGTSYDVGAAARWPAVADFDGDGNADIAVAVSANSIVILKGNGAGGFTLASSTGTTGISAPLFLGTAHLNHDAKPDLVTSSSTANHVTVLLNQSTPGTFAFASTTLTQTAGVSTAILADFDGDTDIDIAVGRQSTNVVTVLLNDGAGNFSGSLNAPPSGTLPANVSRLRDIGDLNGDGRVDLGVKLTDGSFHVMLRNPAGGFNAAVQVSPPDAAFANFDTGFEASADLNGDGKFDLIRVNFATPDQQEAIEVLLGDGSGTNFTLSERLPVRLTDKAGILDLNLDGRPDLTVMRTDVGQMLQYVNTCGTGAPGSASDLELSMTGPANVNNNDVFSYSITVLNHGPSIATNVTVNDIMPFQGMTLLSGVPAQGTCATSAGTLQCALGNMSSGQSVGITVNVQAAVGGTRINFAWTGSDTPDGTGLNNSASFATTVAPGPATLVVTTIDDNLGDQSLRQAMRNANTNVGFTDTITFNIPGGGVHTIVPLLGLPNITDPVAIDGTTQPGYAGSPLIELNGSATTNLNGLNISPGGSTVRGLVINRFTGVGVSITGSGGNAIEGNYIGTDATGTIARPNTTGGVNILNSPNNTIGGTTVAKRNVISGNNGTGVNVSGGSSNGNGILGNLIGTDKNGTAAIPNVSVQSGVNVTNNAVNTIVGGSAPGAGNVVSGNSQNAVTVCCGNGTSGTVVQGNFVGTDITGMVALSNPGIGIDVVGASNTTVGGPAAGARNLVSGNGTGIQVRTGAVNAIIQGNLIGTNINVTADISNSLRAIHILDTSAHTIGGAIAGTGNTVRGGGAGIGVAGTSTGNAIRGNSISMNAAIAIDLNEDGATVNDQNDGDTGANNLQNFPALTAASASGGTTTVDGTLNSGSNTTFTIDFFAGPSCGRAVRYLGSGSTTTVGNDASFHVTGLGNSTAGEFIMATATDPAGNTSEISACTIVP